MNPAARRFPWTIGIGLLLLLLTLALVSVLAQLKARALLGEPLQTYGAVPGFTLTNQAGRVVSLADLHGRVWVADCIFTRCAGPCLRMSRQMKELQDALAQGNPARLVTFTTDPEFDTPPILTKYAGRFGADTNRWMFLTGTTNSVAAVTRDGLKLASEPVNPSDRESENDLFIHSTKIVVVDRHGHLRKWFDTAGEGVDWQIEKKKILAAVRRLEREP